MKPPKFYRMFNYDKRLLPNAYLAELEEGVDTIELAREKSGATIGYPGWGLLYHILLCHLDRQNPQFIIETGTNWGCTSIVLAQALIDSGCEGFVHTFELDNENAAMARQNLRKAGVADRVILHEGDSRILLPQVLSTLPPIRTAFLDASHLENDVRAEFESVLPHLTPDALVVFDNTYCIALENEDQRVNGFLRTMTKDYGGNLINFEFVSWFTPGLAIWQRQPNL